MLRKTDKRTPRITRHLCSPNWMVRSTRNTQSEQRGKGRRKRNKPTRNSHRRMVSAQGPTATTTPRREEKIKATPR